MPGVCLRPIADIRADGHVGEMTFLDIPRWLPLAMCIPLAVALFFGLKSKRPRWSENRTALLAALPVAIMVIVFGVWDFTNVIWPDEIDSAGKVGAVLLFLDLPYALVVFVVGYIAARFSLRVRKR